MRRTAIAATLAFAVAGAAHAQGKSTADGIAEYRKMLEDGNPAELFEAKGEDLWKRTRGPKNVSMEQCDLGRGPGVVKGVFVTLPRYFPDTKRVQDLESRLMTCMETLQGIPAAEVAKTPFGRGEQQNMEALVAWISAESRGMRFDLSQSHPAEREMYELSSASAPSSIAAARTTSPVRRATARRASASACRTCRCSPRTRAMAWASPRGRPIA